MRRGFTLIELLVVIAIIGLLSSVVLASLNSARAKAKTAAVNEEFHQIQVQVDNVRDTQNKVLGLITGNWCTECAFSGGVKAITQSSALAANVTSWSRVGWSQPPIDPWGAPYTFEENELEFNASDCRYDQAASAGPDGIFYTADDLNLNISHFTCP